MRLFFVFALAVCALAHPAAAYIDIQPSLGRIVRESSAISILRVEKVSRDKRVIIFTKSADLRGQLAATTIKHELSPGHPPREPRHILDWAQPGRPAVCFIARGVALICIGRHWYETSIPGEGDEQWWRMTLDRPELSLAYCGSATKLAKHVTAMLEGKTTVITTVPHGLGGMGTFSAVVFNTIQSGAQPLQRIRASLRMPTHLYYIGTDPRWLIGPGAATPEDVPAMIEALKAEDLWERIEAIDELGAIGSIAKPAVGELQELLKDENAMIRLRAAAAIARIEPHERSIGLLIEALKHKDADVRRDAARSIASIGAPAERAMNELLACTRDADPSVRIAAVDALGCLEARAAAAMPRLIEAMDDAALRTSAIDALGRIGPQAYPAMRKLSPLLGSDDALSQWSAAKAMVLIGGPRAKDAVPFLIGKLEISPRSRELYQLTWLLGLLGETARDALPALKSARERDNELACMAIWAIDPERSWPWVMGYHADRDCDLWLFADYIKRMGDRARPAAAALAKQILTHEAGRVPQWGYHLLVVHADAAMPVFIEALNGGETARKLLALHALGKMGPAAEAALPKLRLLAGAEDRKLAALAQFAVERVESKQ